MFVELSDVLFNEIRFVRTLYEGGPLKTRFVWVFMLAFDDLLVSDY